MVGRKTLPILTKDFSLGSCLACIRSFCGNSMGEVKMGKVTSFNFFAAQDFSDFSRRDCMNQAALTTEICKRLKLA